MSVKYVSRTEAVDLIKNSDGKFMTVLFTKRTTGELRRMNCRTEVKKHLKGGDSTHTPAHKLVTVYDIPSKGYRSIPQEGILEVTIGGAVYKVS